MKVQQIGNYTNQYSSNKTQQSSSNPNFGKFEVIDVKDVRPSKIGKMFRQAWEAVDSVLGLNLNEAPQTARRIAGFEKAAEKTAIEAHFDKTTAKLSPEIREKLQLIVHNNADTAVVNAFVVDGSQNIVGHGQVLVTGDTVKAAKQAVTSAVQGYKVDAGLDKAYGHQRRGVLAQVARGQDKVAGFVNDFFA